MRLGFGDRRRSAPPASKAVAARMKGRLEDRLQHLKHGLLRLPVHHVGNAEVPPPAAGLGDEHPANLAGPRAFPQQRLAKASDEPGSVALRRLDRLPIYAGRSLVAYDIEQRPRQIGAGRHCLQQPARGGRAGDGSLRRLGLRRMQQKGARLGCVRRACLPAPSRAVGECEAQLTRNRPSQSISPFAAPAFAGLNAPTKRSDFCGAVGRSSSPPSRLPPSGGASQTSQGKTIGCAAALGPNTAPASVGFGASRSLAR